MRKITIIDSTLCRKDKNFTFKEKLEIARQLDSLGVDVIELPELEDEKVDVLLVKTLLSLLNHAKLSVPFSNSEKNLQNLEKAFGENRNFIIRLEVPVSDICMEYTLHKKRHNIVEYIENEIEKTKKYTDITEFCAVDSTRADKDFLKKIIEDTFENGVSFITICDSACAMLPDEFSNFVKDMAPKFKERLCVCGFNKIKTATATSAIALKDGFGMVKTQINGQMTFLLEVCEFLRDLGNKYGFSANIDYSKLYRTIGQILWIDTPEKQEKNNFAIKYDNDTDIILNGNDDEKAVYSAIESLGYDLSAEDKLTVYREIQELTKNKNVGSVELDAIIASVALQAPTVYKLKNYMVTSASSLFSNAQINIEKENEELVGLATGNGPIDAAFVALDKIVGKKYELDDFQIKSVTKGKEAFGVTLVKLRSDGRLYSGRGISTDIIQASIMAYLNAINKIVYEES
ncbi:MAG: alpha-isopropylmalate synthase regulatory domain-containing protein [Clostridia bacterium]|nr:alpha-isopropylmalate synthase regulatory domain-containing protein [Clostridia bacterium]